MLTNHEILCLSNMHWDGHVTSKQQIMLRFAKQNRVLYVNRPLSILSPFSGREEISAYRQISELRLHPRQVRPNLYVTTPPLGLPMRYSKFSNIINSKILVKWLKNTMRILGMRMPIIWSYMPESAKIINNLSGRMSIYHCVDEFSEWGIWWNSPSLVRAREREFLEKVDLVIATSRDLQSKKSKFNSNCYFVPNAADFELFSKALDPETQIPSDLSNLQRPIIGYIGTITPHLVDIDFIEYASKESGYTFVFIGRKYTKIFDLSRLEQCKNIYFLGFRDPTQLPGYLKGIDVCIIPHIKSKLMDAAFPLKLFEYLAAGKPVVARRTDELSHYSELLYLVDTPEQFVAAIDLSLSENNIKNIAARVAAAKENTWDARVEEISKIVEKHLA